MLNKKLSIIIFTLILSFSIVMAADFAPTTKFTIDNNGNINAADTIIYKYGYYSINGANWQQYQLSGNQLDSNWIENSASAKLNLPSGTHYALVYSCSLTNNQWNCHENKWQLKTINKAEETNTPEPTPYTGWVYKASNNNDARGVDGSLCPTLTFPPAKMNDGKAGAEGNPTGEPIGGFFGYSRIVDPKNADFLVNTKSELLNAIKNAKRGQIIYVEDDAVIDITGENTIVIPAGVTLASGRGRDFSLGALIKDTSRDFKLPHTSRILFATGGDDIRITGLRIQGGDPYDSKARHESIFKGESPGVSFYSKVQGYGIRPYHDNIEVDNVELFGFSHAGIATAKEVLDNCYHHNYMHHNTQEGLGYGVSITQWSGSYLNTKITALVEGNLFDTNRHSVESAYMGKVSFEARYNIQDGRGNQHDFDRHGISTSSDCTIAGEYTIMHHNTFIKDPKIYNNRQAIGIRGKPTANNGVDLYNNWFYFDTPAQSMYAYTESCVLTRPPKAEDVSYSGNHYTSTPPSYTKQPVVRASFSSTTITAGQSITVDASNSYDPDEKISYIEVDFNDAPNKEFTVSEFGLPSRKFTHTFTQPGVYDVLVRVRNEKGIFSDKHTIVTVNPPSGKKMLSFWIKDTYDGSTRGKFVKEAVLNGEVIWRSDVAGDDVWEHAVIDVSGKTLSGKLTIRLRSLTNYVPPEYPSKNEFEEIALFVDDVKLFGATIDNANFEDRNSKAWIWETSGTGWRRGEYTWHAVHGGSLGYRLLGDFWKTYSYNGWMGISTNI